MHTIEVNSVLIDIVSGFLTSIAICNGKVASKVPQQTTSFIRDANKAQEYACPEHMALITRGDDNRSGNQTSVAVADSANPLLP